ncbi:hypothetical protein TBLA_0D03160 [Henningerozyma blattae CBS 6284]|uniref:AP complex subunit beta n=1 Tax=Henningerozyma blattae (strain ATCC 34711 / CBS 6284 / DSM 70876 / NBRC 10599 / NRRL Y-10934 / UCD 77-7) TaxID=1071380 RepID=I2H364_HENB6|nr:hypothetical protein TBLA_0D03160 [Tetrapisispora blattae CBS 6284]CCH60816.1 hypothetical protein TBLA_0D03160 [Tetrapisispora blattae CBS 6284]
MDQRIFARYKASELKNDLQGFDVKKSKNSALKRKNALKKIIANLTLGNYNEMVHMFPDIINYWKIEDDMEVREICHEYIRCLGPLKPKSAKEALPLILKDLNSKNEKLQLQALNTLISVPTSEFYNEVFQFTSDAINRKSQSSNVTKTAIFSLIQLDDIEHNQIFPFLERLLDILDNPNSRPAVQAACLKTLYTIHEKNNDMQFLCLKSNIVFNILSILSKLNEWDTVYALEHLPISAVPQTHSEALKMIEMTLPQLQHVNSSVALNAMKFIAYLLNYVDHINESIVHKCSNSVISLLDKPPELQFLVLRNVILLLLSREDSLLHIDVAYFFIDYHDPIYIKDTKLECLYLLANKDNLPIILNELSQYATDIDTQMSRKTIRAIGNLAVKLGDDSVDDSVDILLNLLEFGVDYVVEEIISVFRNILRKYPERFTDVIPNLIHYSNSVQEAESKNAMIWIITRYYNLLPNYLDNFSVFSSKIKDESLDVQFSILNSSVKFFVRSPSKETEKICIGILTICTEEINNADLRSRAFMYWRLLSMVQNDNSVSNETVKEIVDGELPLIELDTKLDSQILEELELDIGSISSIYLKPVSQIFRLNKSKYLPKSPALNASRRQLEVIEDSSSTYNHERFTPNRSFSDINRDSSSSPVRQSSVQNYNSPAETVNHLRGKMKLSSRSPSKLSRNPSKLIRRLSVRTGLGKNK